MLASIHPLGERARGNRWGVTVTFYIAGSAAGGGAIGATLGTLGLRASPVVVAALCFTAAVADTMGRPGPSFHRQVNEDWLSRYRGWAYGAGFGFQLGLGIVTIVTTAAVWAALALAALSGSAAAGAWIGLAFGVSRALPVLLLSGVDQPRQLRRAHARLARAAPWARTVTVLGLMGAAAGGWR